MGKGSRGEYCFRFATTPIAKGGKRTTHFQMGGGGSQRKIFLFFYKADFVSRYQKKDWDLGERKEKKRTKEEKKMILKRGKTVRGEEKTFITYRSTASLSAIASQGKVGHKEKRKRKREKQRNHTPKEKSGGQRRASLRQQRT